MSGNTWYIVKCRYFHGYGGSEEVYQIKDSPILEFECTEQEVAHITEAMNNENSLKEAGKKYYYFDRCVIDKMKQPEQWIRTIWPYW